MSSLSLDGETGTAAVWLRDLRKQFLNPRACSCTASAFSLCWEERRKCFRNMKNLQISARACSCLLQSHCCCQCPAVSLDSSMFLLSTIVINQYFSEYVMKALSGTVPSVSVFVWRVYLSSAFHSQKCLF